ncbi:MFS transporter [Kribbella sp. NPDC050124]|uniref:MFS transporter n=1 Tax=Kribbella sp. NPDC050124 TaxID=3364114 RepID=UPI003796DDA8
MTPEDPSESGPVAAGGAKDSNRDGDPRRRLVFLMLMCCVQLLFSSSMTVMTVSLPGIGADFQMAKESLQWLITGYGLAFGGLLLVGGRVADYAGRRTTLVVGLIIFLAGGLACLVSVNGLMLIVGRAVQGIGAAFASPAALSLLTSTFRQTRERGRALGAWAAIGAAGLILGNVGGGLMSSLASWRYSFLPLLLIALTIVVVIPVQVPRGERNTTRRLGILSGALLSLSIGCAILGLSQVSTLGIESWRTWLPLVATVAGAALFALSQRITGTALIPFHLFRSRGALGFAFVALSTGTTMCIYYFSSFFFQDVRGMTGSQAGLAFGVWAATIVAGAQLASWLLPRAGARALLTSGFALVSVGAITYAASLSRTTPFVPWTMSAFILLGVGAGCAGVASTVTAFSSVPRGDQGLAAGVLNSAQQCGGILALSGYIAVASAHTSALRRAGVGDIPSDIAGIRHAVYWAATVAALVVPLALLGLPRRPDVNRLRA